MQEAACRLTAHMCTSTSHRDMCLCIGRCAGKPHDKQYTGHSTQQTLLSIQHTAHLTVYTALHILLCTVYSTPYCVYSTPYCVHSTAHLTVNTAHQTMYTAWHTSVDSLAGLYPCKLRQVMLLYTNCKCTAAVGDIAGQISCQPS